MIKKEPGRPEGFSPGSKYEPGADGTVDYVFLAKERQARITNQRRSELQTDENRRKALAQGKRIEFLVCPVCRMHTPRMVKVNAAGEPYTNPPAPGIQYVRTYKGLERRFVGPTSDYCPLTVRYSAGGRIGSFLNPKESMSPRVLSTVDAELYKHFLFIIEEARKAFVFR